MLAKHLLEVRRKLKDRHLLKDDWDSLLIPLLSVLVQGPQFLLLIGYILVQEIVGGRKVIHGGHQLGGFWGDVVVPLGYLVYDRLSPDPGTVTTGYW